MLPDVVMWLDPGLMTGWSMLMYGKDFDSGQCQFIDVGELVQQYGRTYQNSMSVGWERYIVTSGGARTGTPEPSLETIGMVRWLCYENNVTVLNPVPSAMRMLGSKDKLKTLGWFKPGKQHANDASMHLLSWMLRERNLPSSLSSQLFTE